MSELGTERENAERFWKRYEIPFEHDTCIKVRRSGLMRGSSGTGHAADTVVHLHVLEPFKDGRLSRSEDSYLCENGSHVDFQGREERHVGDGESYVPAVTCQKCLNYMDRWKTDGEVATDGGTDSTGSERSWSSGGATIWCEDGHKAKIVQHVAGTLYECPDGDCDARYKIELEVTPDPKGDGAGSCDTDGCVHDALPDSEHCAFCRPRQALAWADPTSTDADALRALYRTEGHSLTYEDLRDELGLEGRPTYVRVIAARLEEHGLVERSERPSGHRAISLQPSGEELIEPLEERLENWSDNARPDVGPHNGEELVTCSGDAPPDVDADNGEFDVEYERTDADRQPFRARTDPGGVWYAGQTRDRAITRALRALLMDTEGQDGPGGRDE